MFLCFTSDCVLLMLYATEWQTLIFYHNLCMIFLCVLKTVEYFCSFSLNCRFYANNFLLKKNHQKGREKTKSIILSEILRPLSVKSSHAIVYINNYRVRKIERKSTVYDTPSHLLIFLHMRETFKARLILSSHPAIKSN